MGLELIPVEVRRFESCRYHQSVSVGEAVKRMRLKIASCRGSQVRILPDTSMNELDKRILEGLKEATQRAQEETWAQGRPVTIGRDGKVLRIYPDGSEEFVKYYDTR